MSKYLFTSREFAFSNDALHFLRNRFCYKKIKLAHIGSITLTKGKSVKNWVIVLVIGFILLGLCVVVLFLTGKILLYEEFSMRQSNFVGHMILMALILGAMGSYAVYGATKSAILVNILIKSKNYTFRLNDQEKQLTELIKVIRSNRIKLNA